MTDMPEDLGIVVAQPHEFGQRQTALKPIANDIKESTLTAFQRRRQT